MLALVSMSRAIRRRVDIAEIELGRLTQEGPRERKRQKARARPPARGARASCRVGSAASAGAAWARGTSAS